MKRRRLLTSALLSPCFILVASAGADPAPVAATGLEVRVVAEGTGSITLEALIPGAGSHIPPREYAQLIGVPAGPLGPIEVLRVSSLAGSGREEAEGPVGQGGERVAMPSEGEAVGRGHGEGGESVPGGRAENQRRIKPGSELVSLEELGWLRYQRIARLVIRPWVTAPGSGQAPLLQSVTFRLALDTSAVSRHADHPIADSASYEQVLQSCLGNYEDAKRYRVRHRVDRPPCRIVPESVTEYLTLRTDGGGVFRLTGAQLARAGIDLAAVEVSQLRIFQLGRELPVHLLPADVGLAPETTITFWVPEVPDRYRHLSRGNVLALSWSGGRGRSMATRPAFFGSEEVIIDQVELVRRVERDELFLEDDPQLSGRWFWCKLSAEQGAPDSRFLVLPDIHAPVAGGRVRLLLSLHGLTADPRAEADHHVRVILNGEWNKDLYWRGKTPVQLAEELDSGLLVEGDNVVEVRLPGDLPVFADQVLVDWVELRWPSRGVSSGPLLFSYQARQGGGLHEFQLQGPRGNDVLLLEITDPYEPAWIEDPGLRREAIDQVSFHHRFGENPAPASFVAVRAEDIRSPRIGPRVTVSKDLSAGSNRADLIVVADSALAPAVAPLVRHRSAQGLRVEVVTTEEIYQQLSYGFPDPQAIRDLVTLAFTNWHPSAPSQLLLVGDASWDHQDDLGYGARNLLPAFRAPGHSGWAATASDAWYGCVSGDDRVTDLMVGRLAVTLPEEAARIVAKTIRYEQQPVEDWRRRAVLISDDLDRQFADQTRETVEQLLAIGFAPHQLSITELQLAAEMPMGERITRTHEALFPRLRELLSHGVGVLQYIGHGGYRVWAHEELLDVREEEGHLAQLASPDRLPLVLSFSCLNAGFDNPRFDTIGEALVKSPQGGAVAFWAASRVPRFSAATVFRPAFYEALATAGGKIRLGTALSIAKLESLRQIGPSEVREYDSQILLGDPALALEFPIALQSGR